MLPILHRLGFKLSRGAAVLLLIIGIAVAAAFWIGPFRPLPANLHLFVSNATSASPNTIFVSALSRPGAARVRFPLVLAARNNGAAAADPTSLDLSIPSTYRLLRGLHPLTPEILPGNPLARYSVDISGIRLPADSALYAITSDTLWIEPNLPDYDCSITDSVPDFIPPERHSATALSRVPVFYSFEGTTDRQTGMFTAELDSSLLHTASTPMPPSFPTYSREPEAPRPDLGTIRQAGTRTSHCGNPEDPVELYTANWKTDAGGRFLVVYVNGEPRKQLFDLDGDSIIELEMWDPNGDGKFESWRQAQYAIPTILLPERLPIETMSTDSLLNDPQWLPTFNDTTSGPFRFLSDSARARRMPPPPPPPAMPAISASSVDSTGVKRDTTTGVQKLVIDTAWVRKFNDMNAGPYRFLANPPVRRAIPVDSVARKPATPRRRPSNRPLGTPVQMPPLNTGGGHEPEQLLPSGVATEREGNNGRQGCEPYRSSPAGREAACDAGAEQGRGIGDDRYGRRW